MPKDKETVNVREMKGEEKPPSTEIIQGNIPILTLKSLEAINANLITIAKQNAIIIDHLKAFKEMAEKE